jgi:hypothetical protein
MSGPVIGYDSDGLRTGRQRQATAATDSAQLSGELAAIRLPPGMFGEVPAAARFSAVVSGVRDGQVRDADTETRRRGDLGVRTARTADLSAELTADTTLTARSVSATSPYTAG